MAKQELQQGFPCRSRQLMQNSGNTFLAESGSQAGTLDIEDKDENKLRRKEYPKAVAG
jgi:hypothetical protein